MSHKKLESDKLIIKKKFRFLLLNKNKYVILQSEI